jgi:hypothetical protein
MPNASKGSAEAHVMRDCCCDVQLVRASSAPPATSAVRHATTAHALPTAIPAQYPVQFGEIARRSSSTDSTPRGVGPPLILKKHSFLI